MFNIGTIFIAVLMIIILAIGVTLFRMVGFTRWAIIDGLRLNRLFKQPRRESLSFVELKFHAANVLWTKMKAGKPTYRNGSKLQKIHPLSEEQGHKYVTISRDNRPFQNVCHILVDTDIAGIEVKNDRSCSGYKDLRKYDEYHGLGFKRGFEEFASC